MKKITAVAAVQQYSCTAVAASSITSNNYILLWLARNKLSNILMEYNLVCQDLN